MKNLDDQLKDNLINNNINDDNPVESYKWIGYGDYDFYFGDCFGVAVKQTQKKPKKHHLVSLLVEDDGWWYVSSNNGFDKTWCQDIINVLTAVQKKFGTI